MHPAIEAAEGVDALLVFETNLDIILLVGLRGMRRTGASDGEDECDAAAHSWPHHSLLRREWGRWGRAALMPLHDCAISRLYRCNYIYILVYDYIVYIPV